MIDSGGQIVYDDLNSAYPLQADQLQAYSDQGFIHLKHVLSKETLDDFGREITQAVLRREPDPKPMESRTTYEKAFLQVPNLWVENEQVKRFVFSRRLAEIATTLMGTRGVRLYHDQALYKEAGGGITPFHADQYYWPLDTLSTCTAWIPLQATPLEMGPLEFWPKSHHLDLGRDLAISDQSEQLLADLRHQDHFSLVQEPFDLGDVSFHSGWTFHHAAPNASERPRAVMTIIYMDMNARVKTPIRAEQVNDLATWMPGVAVGGVAASPLNPVLYQRREED